jgi:hypothetical protein
MGVRRREGGDSGGETEQGVMRRERDEESQEEKVEGKSARTTQLAIRTSNTNCND